MSGTQKPFYPLNGKKFPDDLSKATDHSDEVLMKDVNDYTGYKSPQFFVNVIIDVSMFSDFITTYRATLIS